ncbi:zwei Ig domain protein zig-8-like isoform X1 [Vespula squamosa]|uniref:Zwei Ig domain protein zig-8-like isoform X1 n=1 Tax=Vespula squamosa TaxID=30214 RepID=A0ABD2AAB7_VESSQ
MRPEFDDCVLETLRDYVTQPAHVREVSKGNSRRNVNDATNDSVGTDLPIFEPTAPNVTAFVGQTVYLPCRVRKLADKVKDLFRCFQSLSKCSRLRISTGRSLKKKKKISFVRIENNKECIAEGFSKLSNNSTDFAHTNAPDRAAFSKFLICALCFSRLVSQWCSGLDFSPQSSVPQRSRNYSAATWIKLPSVG